MSSLARFARLLLLAACVVLAACETSGDKKYDETRGWSAERLYSEAKSELQAGAYKKAIEYYQKLEARYPYGRYAQQALLELAYALYKEGEPALALTEVDRFLKLYPEHPSADYAWYLKGLVNFNEDLGIFGGIANQDMSERDPRSAIESFEAFRTLAERYPTSRYTPDAYARMRYLINALANNEVRVADYYLRRKAYVAALNRAQYVLANYPNTPAVEQALIAMVKAYDAMGLTELRDDADRLLRLNYPSTTYSLKSRHAMKWWQFW